MNAHTTQEEDEETTPAEKLRELSRRKIEISDFSIGKDAIDEMHYLKDEYEKIGMVCNMERLDIKIADYQEVMQG